MFISPKNPKSFKPTRYSGNAAVSFAEGDEGSRAAMLIHLSTRDHHEIMSMFAVLRLTLDDAEAMVAKMTKVIELMKASDAKAETAYIHFTRVPFRAVCGANVPNQQTTQHVEHVDCPACKEAMMLVPAKDAR